MQRHDRLLDQQTLERVAAMVQQQITPLVALETLDDKPWAGHPRHQSESLLCDITGVTHLFGGEAGLLEAVESLLPPSWNQPSGTVLDNQQRKPRLRVRMAIADCVGTAWALAHYARTKQDPGTKQRPAHFIAALGSLRGELEPLPVESLRLPITTVETLARLGVTRVGELLRLPRSGLATRLGHPLMHRVATALGEVDEPLLVHHVESQCRATHLLQYPTGDQAILADRATRLVKEITAELTTRQRGALRLTCRLDLTGHPPSIFEIGLFAPTTDELHLSGLINNRLESKRLPALVERISLAVTLSGPLRCVQNSLFDEQGAAGAADGLTGRSRSMSGSTLSRLIDSLSGRLGRESVVAVTLEDNPLPEKAFSVSPLAGNRIRLDKSLAFSSDKSRQRFRKSNHPGSSGAVAPTSWRQRHAFSGAVSPSDSPLHLPSPADPLRRPCALLDQPIPLSVAFARGPFQQQVDSPTLPQRIRLGGRVHQIKAHWGPERIETGWWQGPSVRRDYYRIETDSGRWWWIFRNLKSNEDSRDNACYCWMLHGRFD